MIQRQTCPICEKELPVDAGSSLGTFPFCSERCRRVDFFRWSEGKYAVVEDFDPELIDFGSEYGPDSE